MAGRRERILALVAAAAVPLGAAADAKAPPVLRGPAEPRVGYALRTQAGGSGLASVAWRGGRHRAAGGSVSVFVSAGYRHDQELGRRWADHFSSLVHGDELAAVSVHVATPEETAEVCGEGALGCYGADRLVTVGEDVGGVAATTVATHEYGHHVAAHRANPPWDALDWGPKRWATAMRVCARARVGELHPGGAGANYDRDPGEGFAETYRLLNERRTDPAASSWPILAAALFPGAEAVAAAERDVLEPWTRPTRRSLRARFVPRGRRSWTLRAATPFDGQLSVTLDLPPAMPYRLALLDAGGRTLARGAWSSATRQRLSHTICGERSVTVRLDRAGPPAPFRLALEIP